MIIAKIENNNTITTVKAFTRKALQKKLSKLGTKNIYYIINTRSVKKSFWNK